MFVPTKEAFLNQWGNLATFAHICFDLVLSKWTNTSWSSESLSQGTISEFQSKGTQEGMGCRLHSNKNLIVHTGPRKLQMNPVSVFSQQLCRKTGVSHCIKVLTLKWLTPCQICLWKSIGGWGWSENFHNGPGHISVFFFQTFFLSERSWNVLLTAWDRDHFSVHNLCIPSLQNSPWYTLSFNSQLEYHLLWKVTLCLVLS